MHHKYRCFKRQGGLFYWQENGSSKRGSLRTKDKAEAERLLLAMNEAHLQPTMNLALGRAYLAAHDRISTTIRTFSVFVDNQILGHL